MFLKRVLPLLVWSLVTASVATAQTPSKEPPPLWDVQVGASFVGTGGNSDTSTIGADFGLHRRWPVCSRARAERSGRPAAVVEIGRAHV